jgi:signal transduction histidine kinase
MSLEKPRRGREDRGAFFSVNPIPAILVIDDDEQVLSLVESFLAPQGFLVLTAGRLSEGRELLKREGVDLLVVDYHLPDGTGLDIVREAVKERPDLGVIVMTGVAVQDVQVAAESIRSGAMEYLTKPFSLPALGEKIRRSLDLQAEKGLQRKNLVAREGLPRRLLSLLEKERQHLAMELHDEIGQTLTMVKMEVEILAAECGELNGEVSERLKQVAMRLAAGVEQVRRISSGLRPPNLDALGLEPALRQLVEELNHRDGMEIRCFFRNVEERCGPDLEVAVYRIVQEAMTNVVRHARANKVFLNVIRGESGISIVVEDDGVGFNVENAADRRNGDKRLGILTMRERVEQFNGKLWIDSTAGRGTCLSVEIPAAPCEEADHANPSSHR